MKWNHDFFKKYITEINDGRYCFGLFFKQVHILMTNCFNLATAVLTTFAFIENLS